MRLALHRDIMSLAGLTAGQRAKNRDLAAYSQNAILSQFGKRMLLAQNVI